MSITEQTLWAVASTALLLAASVAAGFLTAIIGS